MRIRIKKKRSADFLRPHLYQLSSMKGLLVAACDMPHRKKTSRRFRDAAGGNHASIFCDLPESVGSPRPSIPECAASKSHLISKVGITHAALWLDAVGGCKPPIPVACTLSSPVFRDSIRRKNQAPAVSAFTMLPSEAEHRASFTSRSRTAASDGSIVFFCASENASIGWKTCSSST